MNYGQIHGEDSAVYHAQNCVSSHKLADFARPNVPLLFKRKYVTCEAEQDAESPAFAFGEYFHALALEGETVADARYAVSPKFDRRTKQGKADAEAFAFGNAGKTVIDQADHDLAWKMMKAIRAKKTATELFAQGKPEVVFRHKMASFSVQARIDWFDERLDEWKRPTFVDLKTIDSLANFPRQFDKYGYWRQVAFYQLVIYQTLNLQGAFPRCKLVVVEKNEPHECRVFEPDELALDHGRNQVMADLARLKECYDSDNWPGEPDEVSTVSVAEWRLAKGVDK